MPYIEFSTVWEDSDGMLEIGFSASSDRYAAPDKAALITPENSVGEPMLAFDPREGRWICPVPT